MDFNFITAHGIFIWIIQRIKNKIRLNAAQFTGAGADEKLLINFMWPKQKHLGGGDFFDQLYRLI